MNMRITPGSVKGILAVPPSKSHTQRVLAAALLHNGVSTVREYGTSNDEIAALHIIEQLGASVQKHPERLIIHSTGIAPTSSTVHCGESGLAARLFTPIAATSDKRLTITGNGSLLRRPMAFFKEGMPITGVSVEQQGNHLPVTIKGPLRPRNIIMDGSGSSQFLTGLLFAYAFTAQEEVTVTVTDLVSKPYIDLTLDVLKRYGKVIRNERYERFVVMPTPAITAAVEIVIEADWSSAAYWVVAGAINGCIGLTGLNRNSLQADKAIFDVVVQCGGTIIREGEHLQIRSGEMLHPFDFDATDCPDLFPVLSVLATQCMGTSVIKGLHRLAHKESNRQESICTMLERFGVAFRIAGDQLLIEGGVLKANSIPSFNDHRIAMAAAIGALKADGEVVIENAACVSKSYPDFFRHLEQAGINTAVVL